MGLLISDPAAGYIHGEARELARKLQQGDGLMWRGDPDLELRMGILTSPRYGYDKTLRRHVNKGDVVARRYEIYRHTEDGQDVLIGHWRLEEFDRILLDLVQMDPRTPGHVPVADQLDAADEAKEKEVSSQFREAVGPMLEHAMHLAHDRANPRTAFYQVGGEEPAPDKPDA